VWKESAKMNRDDSENHTSMDNTDDKDATSTDRKELIQRVRTEKHPLFLAVLERDFQQIKKVIAEGQEVNCLDPKAWSPLRTAARIGDPAMIKLLLKLKADLKFDDQLPVITAASWGHVDALEVLLTSGKADISSNWKWEVSPLACAAREGRRKIAECLIRHDVDVNAIDESGNDPLIVAWEKNHPEIAFYLVENGAVLKDVRSWALLANFPAAAFQIANGFASHHVKTIEYKKKMNNGQLNAKDMKPAVRIPHETICTWLEKVPSALLILLDKLFTQTPLGVPVRSDMKGFKLRTQYPEKMEEWRPIEEPKLLELCPTDDDGVGGKAVLVRCLHQQGILQVSYFFALVNSSLGLGLLSSESIQNTIAHTWTNAVQVRFIWDFTYHCLTMLALFGWTMSLLENHQPELSITGFVFLTILTMVDTFAFARQFDYYKNVQQRSDMYMKNVWNSTGFSIQASIRILSGWVTFGLAIKGELWIKDHVDEMYHLPLSIIALMQFMQLFHYFRGIEVFGVSMIPMLEAMEGVIIFFIPFLFGLFGLTHGTASLGGPIWKHFLGHTFLDILGYWNKDAVMYVHTQTFEQAVYIMNYISGLALGLLFYNTIVAVIMEKFEFQQEKRYQMFIRERVLLCFQYTMMSEYQLLAPVEWTLNKLLPDVFFVLPQKGILWTAETMDYRRTFDSRLRWIQGQMDTEVKKSHAKAREMIEEMDFELSQGLEKTYSAIEAYRTKLTKSIKREEKKLKAGMSQKQFTELQTIAQDERARDSAVMRNVDQDWMHEGDGDAIALRASLAENLDHAGDHLKPNLKPETVIVSGAAGAGEGNGSEASRGTSKSSRQ
jgi:ankyrin repeat protein